MPSKVTFIFGDIISLSKMNASVIGKFGTLQGVTGLLSFGMGLSHDFISDLMTISDI